MGHERCPHRGEKFPSGRQPCLLLVKSLGFPVSVSDHECKSCWGELDEAPSDIRDSPLLQHHATGFASYRIADGRDPAVVHCRDDATMASCLKVLRKLEVSKARVNDLVTCGMQQGFPQDMMLAAVIDAGFDPEETFTPLDPFEEET